MVAAVSALNTSAVAASSSKASTTDPAAAQDRFLKLLVAQLNNQDPLNPMDNAQMTSQMAQINTVTEIQKLNVTMNGMAGQFAALQGVQSADLVGKQVLVDGMVAPVGADGDVRHYFNLDMSADSVRADAYGPSGELLGSQLLGAMDAGQHDLRWQMPDVPEGTNVKFVVSAARGGLPVVVNAMVPTTVKAVEMSNGQMSLRTSDGNAWAYSDIRAYL